MTIFALVDGNSFYCSCEKAFNPRLRNRPVVVLSNNDGCIIARSAEARAMGIKMGEPWFQVRQRLGQGAVDWFSSNYQLYADMSRRMYEVLETFSPFVEPYSIDEMFIDLSGFSQELDDLGYGIRSSVLKIAKIPTCVGIGQTKTIAKLANKIAKSDMSMNGVCDLTRPGIKQDIYNVTPAAEIWGIGRASAEKLERLGIQTIADFIAAPERVIRDELTVLGLRLQSELKGISCLPLSMITPPKKGMAVTRSFGKRITQWRDMEEAISTFASRGAEKLREQGQLASALTVFMRTNPREPHRRYTAHKTAEIESTSDTIALVSAAISLAKTIWRDGHKFMKAGIMLNGLDKSGTTPHDLFPSRNPVKSDNLMKAIDAINIRYGRNTARLAVLGIERQWQPIANNVSPRYTTDIRGVFTASTIKSST